MEANEIIDQADTGIELANQVQNGLKKVLISGKTLAEWRSYFTITIPPDLNPQTCIDILSGLAGLYQEAAFFKTRADRTAQHLSQAAKLAFNKEFHLQIDSYRDKNARLPSKDTLEVMAEQKIVELRTAEQSSKIELSFWKDVIDNLSTVRKILEQITINLGIERKMLLSGSGAGST